MVCLKPVSLPADMNAWSDELYQFYAKLQPPPHLPNGIGWLYPQQSADVMALVQRFLFKFYSDKKERRLLLGINPGRFGAGVTGVNFTAPRQLKEDCGIDHSLKMQSELSAEFIYRMIHAYGGPELFYQHFFIGSVCPLGFVKGGKNINYYDDKELAATVEPFIIQSMEQLLRLNFSRKVCYCIGGEKNYKYLSRLNAAQGWFDTIVPLPHPRFILQYRRRQVDEYVKLYLEALGYGGMYDV
jgi:hypothetical protein